ncbi:hypothetical protein GCM10025331_79140 [Actinoplanes utahensis]|nr:hypothetical protein Aut01nite_81770 [Actinoplanes utahensis]
MPTGRVAEVALVVRASRRPDHETGDLDCLASESAARPPAPPGKSHQPMLTEGFQQAEAIDLLQQTSWTGPEAPECAVPAVPALTSPGADRPMRRSTGRSRKAARDGP